MVYLILQSAHLAVTEALMALWIRETVNVAKVAESIRRLEKGTAWEVTDTSEINDPEDALIAWTGACCKALKAKILDELNQGEEKVRRRGMLQFEGRIFHDRESCENYFIA